jgi:hypothetical protein
MYVGPGLAGRTTSLESIVRVLGGQPSSDRLRPHHSFEIHAHGRLWQVNACVSIFRAWLWHENPLDPNLDERIVYEIDMLPRCDGFIFVVDVRQDRAEASVEALEILIRDLAARGGELDRFPIVFQANRLNARGADSMDWVRQTFRSRHAGYVASNAKEGIGTVDALRELLKLIAEAHEA